MNNVDSNARCDSPDIHPERSEIERVLRSILDLTMAMERSIESEEFEQVASLMGRREYLMGEFSGLHHPGVQELPILDLLRAIERENSILMAQLQQKSELIAARLQDMRKERAIAHYRV